MWVYDNFIANKILVRGYQIKKRINAIFTERGVVCTVAHVAVFSEGETVRCKAVSEWFP